MLSQLIIIDSKYILIVHTAQKQDYTSNVIKCLLYVFQIKIIFHDKYLYSWEFQWTKKKITFFLLDYDYDKSSNERRNNSIFTIKHIRKMLNLTTCQNAIPQTVKLIRLVNQLQLQ